MAQAWQHWGGIVVMTALALPGCALFAWSLAAWRRTWRDPVTEVGMVAGTLPWLWMVLSPMQRQGAADGTGGFRLVPLVDLSAVLSGEPGTAAVQVIGNLLVFAALGFLLPVRFRLALPAVGAIAGAGSVAIEAAQWALTLGRVSSVDDVLLNTLGAMLAARLSRRWWRAEGSV